MVHVLGIFAHLGLTLTAAISHVYNHSQDKIGRVTTTSDWGYLAAAGVTSPCHFAFLSEAEGSPTPDMTTQTLLVACLVVVSFFLPHFLHVSLSLPYGFFFFCFPAGIHWTHS